MNKNMRNETWLGIDFSGNCKMWSAGCRTSNVWIAQISKSSRVENFFCLTQWKRVQDLPGTEAPFLRLARFLAKRCFEAATIDAPFSIPAEFMPAGGHNSLLMEVGSRKDCNRPFLEGKAFVALVKGDRHVVRRLTANAMTKQSSPRQKYKKPQLAPDLGRFAKTPSPTYRPVPTATMPLTAFSDSTAQNMRCSLS
jgi:hypothetical protein